MDLLKAQRKVTHEYQMKGRHEKVVLKSTHKSEVLYRQYGIMHDPILSSHSFHEPGHLSETISALDIRTTPHPPYIHRLLREL